MCIRMLPAATWVGGGFIVGVTEMVYNPTMGLTWAVVPLGGTLSLVAGKRVFLFIYIYLY